MSRKKDELNQRDTIDNTKNAPLTTNQGLPVSEDEFSLKAGERGPTLMEDFHFREKMTHFDHERIPEQSHRHYRWRRWHWKMHRRSIP